MHTASHTLLRRVRNAHDTQAGQEFSALYRAVLRRYVRAAGLTGDLADELADRCLTLLMEHVATPEYVPKPQRLKLWLRATADRVIGEALWRPPYSETAVESPGNPKNASQVSAETYQRIWHDQHRRHCLEQLRIEVDDRDFEVFRRIALDEWPIERVCAAYDLSHDSVRDIKARLAARVKRLMSDLIGS